MLAGIVSSVFRKRTTSISIFGRALRITWTVLFAWTIAIECMPSSGAFPVWLPSFFVCQLVLLLLLGCVTPLAFWRFDSLGYGLLCCIGAASAPQWMPFVPGPDHPPGYLGLTAKLILMFAGFAIGLSARHDRHLNLIWCRIRWDDSGLSIEGRVHPTVHTA